MCVLNPDNDGARIKAISIGLRDSGFEVIYTGSENNIDQIINAAMQEDVDAIGICSYSNKELLSSFMERIKEKEMSDLSVFVEGSLSKKEIRYFKRRGIDKVFTYETAVKDVAQYLKTIERKEKKNFFQKLYEIFLGLE